MEGRAFSKPLGFLIGFSYLPTLHSPNFSLKISQKKSANISMIKIISFTHTDNEVFCGEKKYSTYPSMNVGLQHGPQFCKQTWTRKLSLFRVR